MCISLCILNIAAIHSISLDVQTPSPPCRECGQICSTDFDSIEEGHVYHLLRKKVNCDNMMHRIVFCPFKAIRPPPLKPLPHMVKNFTMDGHCVFGQLLYSDDSAASASLRYNASSFHAFLTRDSQGVSANHYRDNDNLKTTLKKYLYGIKGKHVAIVGTQDPWAEAIVLNLGAEKVTTIEYRDLYIEHSRVSVVTPFQHASRFLNRTAESFDAVVSYSSIEHTGLGRYGDPLMPYGDIEAVAQIWCALKPRGYLFLAVPMNGNRTECILQWNAHRLYSYLRMQHLTANFKVLEEIDLLDGRWPNTLYVLQKLE